eukprot:TRINITY_DN5698_c0_g1_i1.p1 TRINITY_DN5698_c0_g1~~TRINITY_DN5698_c0_g1_i1.p1  ORF type:complete len:730 (-),score=182.18 TRINITY_DN5698_c0_g1_i1:51-2240(-)
MDSITSVSPFLQTSPMMYSLAPGHSQNHYYSDHDHQPISPPENSNSGNNDSSSSSAPQTQNLRVSRRVYEAIRRTAPKTPEEKEKDRREMEKMVKELEDTQNNRRKKGAVPNSKGDGETSNEKTPTKDSNGSGSEPNSATKEGENGNEGPLTKKVKTNTNNMYIKTSPPSSPSSHIQIPDSNDNHEDYTYQNSTNSSTTNSNNNSSTSISSITTPPLSSSSSKKHTKFSHNAKNMLDSPESSSSSSGPTMMMMSKKRRGLAPNLPLSASADFSDQNGEQKNRKAIIGSNNNGNRKASIDSNDTHRVLVSPNNATPFPCPQWGCPFSFPQMGDVHKHLITYHTALSTSHPIVPSIRGVDCINLGEIPYETFFDRYMLGSQPVLIKGVPPSWREMEDWSLDFLAKKYSTNQAVWNDLEREGDGGIEQYCGTLSEFADSLENSSTLYASVIWPFPNQWEKLPQFQANYIDLLPSDSFETYCRIFIGHTGSFTALHLDHLDTSMTAVKGTKRVILFPPDSWPQLERVFPDLKSRAHRTDALHFFFEIELDESDRQAIASAGGRVVFIKPGNTLFIPAGWYHQVSNMEEETISMSNACVGKHNVLFFIQNEHPEQLNMDKLIEVAIEDLHNRVSKWKEPEVDTFVPGSRGQIILRKPAKLAKLAKKCNHFQRTPCAVDQLLSMLREMQILDTTLKAKIKCIEDDKKTRNPRIPKHIKTKLAECLAKINHELSVL